MRLSATMRTWTFYGACLLVIVLINSHALARFLPGSLATEIGHNREAFGFALLACATIQWFRPWARSTKYELPITVTYGLGLVLFGWWLLHSGLPSDYSTFSESFFGAGMVALYVQRRRPWPLGPGLTVIVLALVVVFFDTPIVLDQSENLVMILLAPLALDIFDRSILDEDAVDRPGLRLAWCVALVLAWFVFWRLAAIVRPDLAGPVDYGIDYAYRAAEAYIGILMLHLYFSYWLGADWRARKSVGPAEQINLAGS